MQSYDCLVLMCFCHSAFFVGRTINTNNTLLHPFNIRIDSVVKWVVAVVMTFAGCVKGRGRITDQQLEATISATFMRRTNQAAK